MRTSRIIPFGLVFGLGAFGCSRSPELVYVDLSSVPQEAPPPLKPPAETGVAKVLSPSPSSLPALSEGELYFAANESALERARDTIRKNRERALKEISARLMDVAIADVKRITDARIEALLPKEKVALDGVYGEARSIFLKYALRAGSATFDLAGLVGFPDPDPKSRRIPDASDKEATSRYEKAKALRTKVDSLGRQFYAEFDSKLGAAVAMNRVALYDLKIEMNLLLEQLLADAQLEAERLTEQSTDDVASQSALREVKLKAEPKVSVSFSPIATSVHPVNVSNVTIRRSLENELQIFAKVRGYELTSNRSFGKNVTAEFLTWRKQFNLGP